MAPPAKKTKAQLAIEDAEAGGADPGDADPGDDDTRSREEFRRDNSPPAEVVERIVHEGRTKTFADRIRDLEEARREAHPQAFYDDYNDYDLVDQRGANPDAPPQPPLWSAVWPPPEWDTRERPTVTQLIHRAVTPYQTQLAPEERLAFGDWLESHPDALASEPFADQPNYDWAGYWRATQREGASGPESKLPLSHWETPYSPRFAQNPGSKYQLPVEAADTVPKIVDRAANPYRTRLTPAEEKDFLAWRAVTGAPHTDHPQSDYDLRGYFHALRNGDPRAAQKPNGEYPDAWKTPFHRTFSDQSVYAQPGAPSWHGDSLVSPDGRIISTERAAPPRPTAPPARPKTLPDRPQTLGGVIEDWTARFGNRPGDEEEALWTGRRGPAAPRDLPLSTTQPTPAEVAPWRGPKDGE